MELAKPASTLEKGLSKTWGGSILVFVAMVIVAVSAAQVVWALFPVDKPAPWASTIGLGPFGCILGGIVFASALLHQSSIPALVPHPLGLRGSAVGTVVFVGAQLARRNRL